MNLTGSLCMYNTKKIITREINNAIPIPNTMYKMKNIHANGSKGSDHVSSTASSKICGNITDQNLQSPPEMTTLLQRQEKILLQLTELRQQMISLKTDLSYTNQPVIAEVLQSTFVCPLEVDKFPEIIINANPAYPPYSLLLIQRLCKNVFRLQVTSHLHSSVTLHDNIKKFLQAVESFTVDHKPAIDIRLIWKNIGPYPELILSQIPIVGEVNILRYFSRIIPNVLKYETLENYYEIDHILDNCHTFLMTKSKSEQAKLLQNFNSKLGKSNWLCGMTNISIADVAAYSVVKQIGFTELPQNVSKWFQRCETAA